MTDSTTEETARVTLAWHRVETWLRCHAPASALRLRPGSTPKQIAEAEAVMSRYSPYTVTIHPTLRTWWALCNGTGPQLDWDDSEEDHYPRGFLPDWYTFISVEGSAELHGYLPDRFAHHADFSPLWIPFAMFDPDGESGLYVDGRTGRIGEWTLSSPFEADGPTLGVYLEQLANALEEGRGIERSGVPLQVPHLLDGSLRWFDAGSTETEGYVRDEGWRPAVR